MEVTKEVCDIKMTQIEKMLTQHDDTIRQLTECTQKLTYIISTQEEKQKDIDKRLKKIESRPGMIFEKILIAGLTALVSVLITILIQGAV